MMSVATVSSSTLKCGGTSASNGKRCNSFSQKLWMVCTFMPPGVSIDFANKRRASSISCSFGSFPKTLARLSLLSMLNKSSVGIVTHLANVSNNLFSISAAAALVKVRHKILWGSLPRNKSRSTRLTRMYVLPVPALAETKADVFGSAALA